MLKKKSNNSIVSFNVNGDRLTTNRPPAASSVHTVPPREADGEVRPILMHDSETRRVGAEDFPPIAVLSDNNNKADFARIPGSALVGPS